MSELFQALCLGIVQGLTEFLPVSSSGHIEIAEALFNQQALDQGNNTMAMTVVLHFATALSTVVVFRREILEIWKGLLASVMEGEAIRRPLTSRHEHADLWFCVKIVLSMIPAALVGVLLEDQIEQLFNGQLILVGAMLVVTGVLLLLADRAKVTDKEVGLLDSIIIGVAQAIAILPGISRSGATISTSVLLGIDRSNAARFSFLMVVPLIFGKMGYDVLKMVVGEDAGEQPFYEPGQGLPLLVGFLAAFATGWLACTWMIKLVKACKLYYFSIYCFVVAAIVLASQLVGGIAG